MLRRQILVLAAVVSAAAQESPLRRAAQLDAEHKCEESEAIYRKALAQGPPSAPLLNNAGNHYLVCGDVGKAQVQFEKLLKLDPRHPNANLQLARLAAERHDGARAQTYLARVPDSQPSTKMLRAEAAHWAGKKAEAVAALDALEPEAARDLRLRYLLGLTYARIEAYDRAEKSFAAVAAVRLGDPEALLNLGRAAARAGHSDRAQSVLEAAVRLNPSAIDPLLELGRLASDKGDFTRAVYYLSQARSLAPGRADIVLSLARASQAAAYYGDAALAYEQYLRLKPDDDTAHRDHALATGVNSNTPAALAELNAYIAKHPRDAVAYYNLAQLVWRADPDRAIAHLKRASELDPSFTAARIDRAWLLQRQGAASEALSDLDAALRAEPNNVRALDLLGLSYLSLDRAADAEPPLRKALALAPEDPDALMHLGRALIELGNNAEGEKLLARYQTARPAGVRGPRRQAGLIEAASMAPAARNEREIERLRAESALHPDDPELQLAFAGLLMTAGRAEEAATQFRVLSGRNPGAAIEERAGEFLLGLARYPLARDFLQAAVAARPAVALDLAIATYFADGPSKALEALKRIENADGCGDCLLLKASILGALGDKAASEGALAAGLALPPARPKILQLTATLLARQGRADRALALLEKAANGNPDLLLTRALLLGLQRDPAAAPALRRIEAAWPEWGDPYLAEGLLLESAARIRTARALGANPCARSLADMLFSPCTER